MLTDPIGWFGRRGIYYGWVIVAVMFLTLFVSTGFRFAFGVYYSAILDETGWGRAETAGVVSAAMIVYACTAALSGYLFDRLGARVLFPIGALCMGAGLMLCSTAKSLVGLTASYGILMGLSYAALGFIPHMAIVPRWFDRRRGLASALSLAGSGVGSLAIAALSAELIVHVGWRETMWWFGIAAMVVLIPSDNLGMQMMGFTSGDAVPGDRDKWCVFVPGTPNPVVGRLYFVPRERCRVLDISVEEAFKFLISTGNYIPNVATAVSAVQSESLPP